eukprot:201959-Prorocentrum_lima.AAC.1
MTSSLVGSEMCIRDRWHADSSTAPPRPSSPLQLHRRISTAWTFQDSKYAVSYTHLTLPTICSV